MVVDRLEVHLPGQDEVVVREAGVAVEGALDHQPHRVLHEARGQVCVFHDEELVRALEQLIDGGAHRALDDLDEVFRVQPLLRAEEKGAAAALVVGGERDELEDALDVSHLETGLGEPVGSLGADEALRAGARVDSGGLDSDDAA